MKPISIYLAGVGGQGTTLLSDVIGRAAADAGLSAMVSDTHGIAQRGGSVVSHIRIGEGPNSPLICKNQADIVIALERLEALRGACDMLKNGGILIYCNAVFQPASVRTQGAPYPSEQDVSEVADKKVATIERISTKGIHDPKMYNTLVLARLVKMGIVPEFTVERSITAISHTLPKDAFERNKELFLSTLSSSCSE